jgi:hypothetical protein
MRAADVDDAASAAWLEVPPLVEDAVVRELDLVVPRLDLAVPQQRCGVVVAVLAAVDEAGEDRASALRAAGKLLEGPEVVLTNRGAGRGPRADSR